MQVGGFDQMLAQAIAEAVAPLAERIRQLEAQVSDMSTGYTDVSGKKGVFRLLGCTQEVYARLMSTKVLGYAIYKTSSKKQAGVRCLVEESKRRYEHYIHLTKIEQQAWEMLGADLAERKWKEIGL